MRLRSLQKNSKLPALQSVRDGLEAQATTKSAAEHLQRPQHELPVCPLLHSDQVCLQGSLIPALGQICLLPALARPLLLRVLGCVLQEEQKRLQSSRVKFARTGLDA